LIPLNASVIEAGIKVCQGESIVNSISFKRKEGREFHFRQASCVRKYGAAVIVMLLMKWQADKITSGQ